MGKTSILIFGTAAVDITSQTRSAGNSSSVAATTYPGRVTVTLGGVARNMAETATRVLSLHPASSSDSRSPVKLVSPHGDDDFGLLLKNGMEQAGMRTDGLFVPEGPRNGGEQRTAVCSLLLDDAGDLISGVADMDIGQAALVPSSMSGGLEAMLQKERPGMVVFDGNIGAKQTSELLAACESYNTKSSTRDGSSRILTSFEPTSVSKSTAILSHYAKSKGAKRNEPISFATPNAVELQEIHSKAVEIGIVAPTAGQASATPILNFLPSVLDPLTVAKACSLVQAGIFSTILLKVGRHGVVTIDASRVQHHPIPAGEVRFVNTTGCGDSFAGAFAATISHLLSKREVEAVKPGKPAWHVMIDKAVNVGQLAARKTLASTQAVGEGMHLLLDDII